MPHLELGKSEPCFGVGQVAREQWRCARVCVKITAAEVVRHRIIQERYTEPAGHSVLFETDSGRSEGMSIGQLSSDDLFDGDLVYRRTRKSCSGTHFHDRPATRARRQDMGTPARFALLPSMSEENISRRLELLANTNSTCARSCDGVAKRCARVRTADIRQSLATGCCAYLRLRPPLRAICWPNIGFLDRGCSNRSPLGVSMLEAVICFRTAASARTQSAGEPRGSTRLFPRRPIYVIGKGISCVDLARSSRQQSIEQSRRQIEVCGVEQVVEGDTRLQCHFFSASVQRSQVQIEGIQPRKIELSGGASATTGPLLPIVATAWRTS